MRGNQRFDFLAQVCLIATGAREEYISLAGRAFNRDLKYFPLTSEPAFPRVHSCVTA
jgi:hypothetical protein